MNESNPPKLKRRWFQFSLRSLLLVILACSMALGWRLHQARVNRMRQAKIMMALAELGEIDGWCPGFLGPDEFSIPLEDLTKFYPFFYSALRHDEATWLESLFNDPGGEDAHIRTLKGTGLLWVVIQDKKLSDDQLKYLNALPILDTLEIEKSNLTDAALTHLEQMSKLKYLDLHANAHITNTGVERLRQKLPHCQISWEPKSDKGEEETGIEE